MVTAGTIVYVICVLLQYHKIKEIVQLYSNNTSGHKGVSWDEERGKWKASLHMIVAGKNKTKFLGRFYDKILAARAYDRAAIKHFGKFAFTNFPLTDYLTPEEINEMMSK